MNLPFKDICNGSTRLVLVFCKIFVLIFDVMHQKVNLHTNLIQEKYGNIRFMGVSHCQRSRGNLFSIFTITSFQLNVPFIRLAVNHCFYVSFQLSTQATHRSSDRSLSSCQLYASTAPRATIGPWRRLSTTKLSGNFLHCFL